MQVRYKEDPREWRKNVWLTVGGLALVSSLLRWRRILPREAWLTGLGLLALVAFVAWLRPTWFRGFYRWSMRAGFWLSQIVARCVLVATFFLLVTPLGWVLRALGKDPLRMKRSAPESYWQAAKPPGPLDRLF
jgi:hypothetical protein